jgi:hypothetical protein
MPRDVLTAAPAAWSGSRVRRAIPLCAVLLAARCAAALPCADEPGLEGLACRVDALGAEAVAQRMRAARAACETGRTSAAIRELRGMRRPLARAGGDADVLLADALRRATIDRLRRRPCPELVEVLSPRRHEQVRGGELFVLLRLAPAADPATLSVRFDDAAPVFPEPGNLSATQAWLRLPCASGRHRLHVSVGGRGGARGDAEEVPVACGSDDVLGAEVDTLVLHDYVPERLRIVPVRPLRGGATYALVATRRLRTSRGRVDASAAFRAAAGLPPRVGRGVEAIYTDDPLDPANPFPSARLLRADGTVIIPDGFSARALPAVSRLDGVRAFLRRLDRGSEEHHGFSPNTFVVLALEAPVRLDDATADRLVLLEAAPGTDLPALLDALERERGLDRRRIAVATCSRSRSCRGSWRPSASSSTRGPPRPSTSPIPIPATPVPSASSIPATRPSVRSSAATRRLPSGRWCGAPSRRPTTGKPGASRRGSSTARRSRPPSPSTSCSPCPRAASHPTPPSSCSTASVATTASSRSWPAI